MSLSGHSWPIFFLFLHDHLNQSKVQMWSAWIIKFPHGLQAWGIITAGTKFFGSDSAGYSRDIECSWQGAALLWWAERYSKQRSCSRDGPSVLHASHPCSSLRICIWGQPHDAPQNWGCTSNYVNYCFEVKPLHALRTMYNTWCC